MKRRKVRRRQSIFFFGIILILIIFCTTLIGFKYYSSSKVSTKKSFQIESRLKNVKMSNKEEESNYKTIGWVRVEGTNIDYPVIHSSSPSSGYPVEYESYGWSINNDTKFHNRISIIGHNIFNLSSTPKIQSEKFKRFEALMAFVYYDFAKDNRNIQLTIDGKDYLYKIFSIGFVSVSNTTSFPYKDDYSLDEMKDHIDILRKNSFFDYDIDVNENDSIVSLITCTRFFGSQNDYEIFVNARLLREGEKIDNYGMKKNNNYDLIQKILKGDEYDEEDSL